MDRYEEALKRAKAAIEVAAYPEEVRKVAETIFPELAESEDERIREELDAFIRGIGTDYQYYVFLTYKQKQRFLTYLEKQKEPFESGRGLYYYDGEKTTYCGYPATEENPYDFAMSQQKEQQPAEWSEEDEKIIQTMIKEGDLKPSEIAWLKGRFKSLRPQPHWKPSEEQMEALRRAVNKLSHSDVADSVRLSIMHDNLKKLM